MLFMLKEWPIQLVIGAMLSRFGMVMRGNVAIKPERCKCTSFNKPKMPLFTNCRLHHPTSLTAASGYGVRRVNTVQWCPSKPLQRWNLAPPKFACAHKAQSRCVLVALGDYRCLEFGQAIRALQFVA